MKNFLLAILLMVVLVPAVAQAAPDIGTDMAGKIATGSGYDKANELSLSQQIGKYIRVALSLSGTIFLALTIYAGFLWMTASGNEDQVTKAKDIIMRASLGMFITLAAFSITAFVISATTSGTTKTSNNVGGSAPSCTDGFFTCWYQGFKNAAQNNAAGVPVK
ncbi:MAG: hypothetical protein NT034_03895 [Candidatus Magasanikbacteria bacterium]|nr:hypothetical protein [Candidatus Magasanikbacteria bacterium]